MNRFFDIEGDLSTQLAPWILKEIGLPIDNAVFRLEKDLSFRSDIAGGVIAIHAPYNSDLASIPRALWQAMAPDDPRIELGAWVHDWLYQNQGKVLLDNATFTNLSRKQCDEILAFEAMPDLFAEKWQQHAVYQALRRFGQQWPKSSFMERLT